jgi:hypothetical protein
MRHQFSTENQTAAQKTYRAWQHNTPLCYRLIFNNHIATVNKRILDYGCGPDAKYVTRMLALGMNAVGIDFGIPGSREMHLNPGKEDERQGRKGFPHDLQKFDAIHLRHLEIGYDGIVGPVPENVKGTTG